MASNFRTPIIAAQPSVAPEISVMVERVVRAKTKIKDDVNGWSLVSAEEIVALAWFADLFLVDAGDGAAVTPPPLTITPTISDL